MIDSVALQFSEDNLLVLNIILAFIMLGVALELKVSDFKLVFQYPKASLVGIFSQFVLLPVLTFILVWIIEPTPSIALGMMLVAACPGGNVSNFMTHFARGNTALSVSLTAIGTTAAVFMTPFNLNFWASLYPPTAALLREVSLSPFQVFKTIFILAGIPLAIGIVINHYWSSIAQKLASYAKPTSILMFISFIIVAFTNNMSIFINYMQVIVVIVFIHNAMALGSGYWIARAAQLSVIDQRTIAIETGIQNSGLGLALIFNFFNGLGGMAIIAAWWGIWHLLAGLSLSYYWSVQQANRTA